MNNLNLDQLIDKRMSELDLSRKRAELAKKFEEFMCTESIIDEENNIDLEVENCLNCFRVVITFNVIKFFWNFMYLKKDEVHCTREIEIYSLEQGDQVINRMINLINEASIVDQEYIVEIVRPDLDESGVDN